MGTKDGSKGAQLVLARTLFKALCPSLLPGTWIKGYARLPQSDWPFSVNWSHLEGGEMPVQFSLSRIKWRQEEARVGAQTSALAQRQAPP